MAALPVLIPSLIQAVASVIPEVGKLLMDKSTPPRVRNMEAAKIALGKIAEATRPKDVRPEDWNEQRAVDAVLTNRYAADAARTAIINDYERLLGIIAKAQEIDDASMDRAATRAVGDEEMRRATGSMLDRAFYALCASLIAVFALMIVEVIITKAKPSGELIGLFIMLVTTTATVWTLTYNYRFGSSSGSAASGAAVRAIAERKGG